MTGDLADKHKAKDLGKAKGKPANAKAQAAEDNALRILTVEEIMTAAYVQCLAKKPRGLCMTGIYQLDHATGGIQPGMGWLIGADTSFGKSSLCVAIADVNLQLGRRPLIVSNEDPEELYGERLLLRRSRVDANHVRLKKLEEDERDRMSAAVKSAEKKYVFLDARKLYAEDVATAVEKLIATEDIDLVIYDYLQEFRLRRRVQDRRNEVSEVSRLLRSVVKGANRATIMFSQITVSDQKKRPDKHSIRESRDASNGADVILLGYEPKEAITAGDGKPIIPSGTKCLWVDKIKKGPKEFIIELDWDKTSACFNNIAGDGYDKLGLEVRENHVHWVDEAYG